MTNPHKPAGTPGQGGQDFLASAARVVNGVADKGQSKNWYGWLALVVFALVTIACGGWVAYAGAIVIVIAAVVVLITKLAARNNRP